MAEPVSEAAAFLRAIGAMLARVEGAVVEEMRTRPWTSAHFRGARHEFAFRFQGPLAGAAADRFLARFRSAAAELPGRILADLALLEDQRRPGCTRLRVEALTVEAERL